MLFIITNTWRREKNIVINEYLIAILPLWFMSQKWMPKIMGMKIFWKDFFFQWKNGSAANFWMQPVFLDLSTEITQLVDWRSMASKIMAKESWNWLWTIWHFHQNSSVCWKLPNSRSHCMDELIDHTWIFEAEDFCREIT